MALAVGLIRAEVEAILFLTQVIRNIHIPQQWQLTAIFLRPCFDLGDFFGQQVLVAHDHGRNGAATKGLEPFSHALCVIPCRVHHIVACDVALFGVHGPGAIVVLGDAGGRAEPNDLLPHVTRALGQRLR